MPTNVVPMKVGRGGARPGAGRKIGSLTKAKAHFVYVIHEVDDATVCKIGIANDPIRRLSAHQVSTWRRLKLAAVFVAETPSAAMAIEASVHRVLYGAHVSGEWFKVEPARACSEIVSVSECAGLPVEPLFRAAHETIKI